MNWRATAVALLWFALLGPLLIGILAASGMALKVVELGPSLHSDSPLLYVATAYAYMVFAPIFLAAGLIFVVGRKLSAPRFATQMGAIGVGAVAGAVAMVAALAFINAINLVAVAAAVCLGAIVGALCGGLTHWSVTRTRTRLASHDV
ncbi:hypothetical protein FXN63_22475 [Pigmentiphaga aceris]|uniref:Uncharacterized protein n=1 Tax=Pigmentiphaga aceris TaxID=1940612 RepID=A0A5C0B6M5_9BURK|nr:hypothetical protein [Pigmentiphaga aceris]QEI08287.1 hypothetical protein FXN63_22475 [Pigmentiphaga aceris]